MTKIIENAQVKNLTTFRVPANAQYLAEIESEADILAVLEHDGFAGSNNMLLGGGSNLLFTGNYSGWLLQMKIDGITVVSEDNSTVFIRVGAGVNWHQLVMDCIDSGWYGIENLALIPGTAGAAPVQNIGAYGVEVSSLVERVSAINIKSGARVSLGASECEFAYRDSLFKHNKDLLVTDIVLRLSKIPRLQVEYGAISKTLEVNGVINPTPADVKNAVVEIRRSKLPDPEKLGNAGSFFKNPVVSSDSAEALKQLFPNLPVYNAANGKKKISAAWMIDSCGWKGKRHKNCGVYEKHALVLVNYGGATGGELAELARLIQDSVQEKFSVRLEPEVQIIN